ncbi:hypothetical protein TSAR_003927 [Trichomalopsis sarcophagae]|uniref:CCHC-type domain-containing protein n=1 Tax=Trichomalopsis sarcophagae TaxID=543379 RepID=A0A232EZF6_9HYME|nr:hypothetical protein TSAR_003927 [Trichomalopsis sarcophagae]
MVHFSDTLPLLVDATGKLFDSKLAAMAQPARHAKAGGGNRKSAPQQGRSGSRKERGKSPSPKRKSQRSGENSGQLDQREQKWLIECFKCRGKGHIARECPLGKGNDKKEE